jgi:phospholipid N-methyltransferase
MSKMKRKLELIYEMMEELSPSQKKAILEITYIDQSVTKRILDHRKKLIDEYISEVIKPVDK